MHQISQYTHDHSIIDLFPVPLYKSKLQRELTLEEQSFIFGLPYETYFPEVFATPTSNRAILDLPELLYLKEMIQVHIDYYSKEIMSVDNNFYFTSSWLSINKKGAWHSKHSHGNSIISGALYLNVDDNSSPIIFSRSNSVTNNDVLQFKTNKLNKYNELEKEINVFNYDLYLWPSWVPHEVPPNNSDTARLVLSFNTFIKGNLGEYKSSTFLKL